MAEGAFNFKKFIDESKQTLLNPGEYFAAMAKEGGFGEPIIKALVYGLVAGLISLIWSVLNLSAVGGAQFGGMMGGGVGIMALVWSLVGALIGVFISGLIMLILSLICGGSKEFEANLRASASIMVLMPVSALFNFIYSFSLSVGGIVSLLVMLYGLYLVYIALTKALGGSEGAAKVITVILAAIPVLMLISSLMCASALKNSIENPSREMQEQSQRMMEQSQKLIEKMQQSNPEAMKALEDAKKELEKGQQ